MFKKFAIGALFKCAKGDVDLQQKDINGKGCYFINSGIDHRGIKGKTDRPARVFPPNTITIDFWGNAYYRDFEYKLATHNHVFSFSGPVIKNKLVGLYLEGALSKLPTIFSYNNMATWNKLKDIAIELPVIESPDPDHEYTVEDIDFEYMQEHITALERERIAELEREHIAELDAYLVASGIDDYELTDEDKEILSISLQNPHLTKQALRKLISSMGN
ncbi:restriction endonuclease subunit S [Bilifractor sp. LCP19S3_H10]|uniref:restriction endonuclease subunit S n=1 Tax=Bilifractor sp. LCP19S3_H10 TaxID=3438736 RepID=UPI003F90A39F